MTSASLFVALFIGTAAGHGMMTHPPTRFPNVGPDFAGLGAEGSVFWFNQGCSPGCETPSGELCDKFEKNGAYACCESAMEPTLHAGGPAELSPRTFADLELPGAEPIDQYR